MRIGFDAKKSATNLTGIGNYSRSTVNALAERYPADSYLLYSPRKPKPKCAARMATSDSVNMVTPRGMPGFLREWWRCRGVTGRLKKDGVDIFHGLSNELPFGIAGSGVKSVVTIHDLIFLRLPETYGRLARMILTAKTKYACRHANRIIAISEQTKRDIVEFYGIDPSKIEVIYQSCDPIFGRSCTPGEIEAVRAKYSLPGKYVLSVGTLEPRKNHRALIEALPLVADRDIHLVLVSKPTPLRDTLARLAREKGVAERVHFISSAPNGDLPPLYQGALAFGYMSVFEGFGIPVLEACISGTPVIAATGSCLEEAGGDGQIYLAPDDIGGIAGAISRIASDPALRASMAEAGRRHAATLSPDAITDRLHDFYTTLLKGS